MKVPISKRLLCCAGLVPEGVRLADIGTDHGYLGIHLLLERRVQQVIAADVRPMPLDSARKNSAKFGVADRMDFRLSDGLEKIRPEEVDVIVCAGMGGDLMLQILQAAPWLKDSRYALILQPQSAQNVFRRWLCEMGFCIETEALVEDGGHLYTALRARYDGQRRILTPGQQYLTPQLLASGSPLLPTYIDKIVSALSVTIQGLRSAEHPQLERLTWLETAQNELLEMRKSL